VKAILHLLMIDRMNFRVSDRDRSCDCFRWIAELEKTKFIENFVGHLINSKRQIFLYNLHKFRMIVFQDDEGVL
jgi:hypothetical protein